MVVIFHSWLRGLLFGRQGGVMVGLVNNGVLQIVDIDLDFKALYP